jgi:hypothetical protein
LLCIEVNGSRPDTVPNGVYKIMIPYPVPYGICDHKRGSFATSCHVDISGPQMLYRNSKRLLDQKIDSSLGVLSDCDDVGQIRYRRVLKSTCPGRIRYRRVFKSTGTDRVRYRRVLKSTGPGRIRYCWILKSMGPVRIRYRTVYRKSGYRTRYRRVSKYPRRTLENHLIQLCY